MFSLAWQHSRLKLTPGNNPGAIQDMTTRPHGKYNKSNKNAGLYGFPYPVELPMLAPSVPNCVIAQLESADSSSWAR